jgi:hypothetical protein
MLTIFWLMDPQVPLVMVSTCRYLSWVLVGTNFPQIQVEIFSTKIPVDPDPGYLWIHL